MTISWHSAPSAPVSGNIEVDQSGKIERTNTDTVLAFSDGISRAVRIPASVKREALELLRTKRRRSRNSKVVYWQLFVVGLHLLLREYWHRLEHVTIDTEYTGREIEIRGMLLMLIRVEQPGYPSKRISFRQVGKSSPAHHLAWQVHRGLREADHRITLEEILALLQK